jgi:hypothetical protein
VSFYFINFKVSFYFINFEASFYFINFDVSFYFIDIVAAITCLADFEDADFQFFS